MGLFRKADDDSLFGQIHAYLTRIREREKSILETEFKLKQVLYILAGKDMTFEERAIHKRTSEYVRGLESERTGGAVQAKAK